MANLPRPYRNRVNPLGEIVATPEYGTLMGNRGCLHDEDGQIIRQASRIAWISCLPRLPGVRRTLMKPGHYTELFFLDEATALAAGHRPCGACRPEALLAPSRPPGRQRMSFPPCPGPPRSTSSWRWSGGDLLPASSPKSCPTAPW